MPTTISAVLKRFRSGRFISPWRLDGGVHQEQASGDAQRSRLCVTGAACLSLALDGYQLVAAGAAVGLPRARAVARRLDADAAAAAFVAARQQGSILVVRHVSHLPL